jgi:YidC/Oxa1 family membrane protein insertase
LNQENQNFLDSRTLVAVLLVGATFIGWQMYMSNKYPDLNKAKTEAVATKADSAGAKSTSAHDEKSAEQPDEKLTSPPESAPQTAGSANEKTEPFTSDTLAFEVSSRGMGLRNIQVVKFKTRKGEQIVLGHPDDGVLPYETRLLNHPEALNFKIQRESPNVFVGHARVGDVEVTKTIEVIPDRYVLDVKVVASGHDSQFTGLSTTLIEDVQPPEEKEGGILAFFRTKILHPLRQKQEFYIDTAEGKDRVLFAKDDVAKSWKQVRLASVGSQYFTQAILDKSPIVPEAKAHLNHSGKAADILLLYPVLDPSANFEMAYTAFIGPKSLTLLRQVDDSLARVVDFGMFSWIGRPILDLLRAFYGMVGNWGIAIILLTCVVRLIVLPVNIYSFKSMRKMQAIQPQLQALRERYKDDQQKQQVETMALMKANNVNPISGCLPMFLQFPIFIALYQVLGNSIELYQAPFYFWIHDLSLMDPYLILPLLMGISMFFQQKLTPNTMDPAQAKMMMMMPLIFTFFMVQLPSGLTLYMLVGALFSIVQQGYFLKQPKTLSSGSKA